MSDEKDKEYHERLFKAFIIMLSNSVLQHMGKLMNPFTGKMEHDFEAAKATLDIIKMLKIKTQDNLTSEEEDLLKRTLAHLLSNYEEIVKEEQRDGMEGKDTKKK